LANFSLALIIWFLILSSIAISFPLLLTDLHIANTLSGAPLQQTNILLSLVLWTDAWYLYLESNGISNLIVEPPKSFWIIGFSSLYNDTGLSFYGYTNLIIPDSVALPKHFNNL